MGTLTVTSPYHRIKKMVLENGEEINVDSAVISADRYYDTGFTIIVLLKNTDYKKLIKDDNDEDTR